MDHFNWLNTVIYPYLNLFLFIFILVKLAKGPLKIAIHGKNEQFEKALSAANQAKEEAERKSKELEKKLAALDDDIQQIQSKAQAQAQSEAEKIVEQATALAEHLKNEAKRIAATELADAKNELRKQVLLAAKDSVKSRLENEFGEAQQLELVRNKVKVIPLKDKAGAQA